MVTRVVVVPARTRFAHRRGRFAFTLVEVMVSMVILVMVIAGVCYGYEQVNRIAIWDSMNQAAQAFAIRGMESARAAKWNPWANPTNTVPNPGAQDELPNTTNTPTWIQTNLLDVPLTGDSLNNPEYIATNYIYVTQYSGPVPIREIRSECVWIFPPLCVIKPGGTILKTFTNIIITVRGPDQ